MYKILDEVLYDESPISRSMFGINFVLSYDMEFLEAGPNLDTLKLLQPDSLRFPGGSLTEMMFSEVDYSQDYWSEAYFNSMQNGITQLENISLFVETARATGASIQLVLPTRIAFEQSAGQAIANGTYGSRSAISPEYFDLLRDYINVFIDVSSENNVEISQFEIGNEFWGGGRMTASEYGLLASTITEFLTENYPNFDVISQVTYNAGLYSPVDDSAVYLVEYSDDFDIYFPFQDLSDIDNLVEYVMPGQGSGVKQTQDIALEFSKKPVALAALDGIVDHVYYRKGFDDIDGERDHALIGIPKTFEDYSGSGPVDLYITEWSARHQAGNRQSSHTNHTGLQYASTTLEVFFELASNGVDGANFWPLTFGNENIDRRVLIDSSENDLTFGGQIFSLMSSTLIGLVPAFDFEVDNNFDVHGFSNENSLAFFVSERSGARNNITLDFSDYSFDSSAFLSVTYLDEDGETGVDINANPVVTQLGGVVTTDKSITLNLEPWSIAVVDLKAITEFDDQVLGTIANDKMVGKGGNDRLEGLDGNDTLSGNLGNDTLVGGSGDDVLKGGWGDDQLWGGSGNDFINGTYGKNYLNGGVGDDIIIGNGDENYILGLEGSDTIELTAGTNFVDAGHGNDEIYVHHSEQKWGAGYVALNVHLDNEAGLQQAVHISGFEKLNNVIDGGDGWDKLILSTSNDALFLDDQHSLLHPLVTTNVLTDGSIGVGRISNIEQIYAGQGNDVIDLTSSRFSLAGTSIEIFGEDGNDTLWGSDADEKIFGGNGDDFLFGGGGSNALSGGDGADTFDFDIKFSGNTIIDFNGDDGDILRIFGANDAESHTIFWNGEALEFNFNFERDEISFHIDIGLEWSPGDDLVSEIDWDKYIVIM